MAQFHGLHAAKSDLNCRRLWGESEHLCLMTCFWHYAIVKYIVVRIGRLKLGVSQSMFGGPPLMHWAIEFQLVCGSGDELSLSRHEWYFEAHSNMFHFLVELDIFKIKLELFRTSLKLFLNHVIVLSIIFLNRISWISRPTSSTLKQKIPEMIRIIYCSWKI